MVVHLVRNTIFWLNAFPVDNGWSSKHSPHRTGYPQREGSGAQHLLNATLQIHTPSYGGPFGAQYNLLAECISCRQWMVIQAFATLYHDRETSGLQQTCPG